MALFDFSGGNLPAGATLTRASTGSYYDAGGVLQSAAVDVARFERDYNGALLGLLLEPARTNSFYYSRDLTQHSASGTAAATATLLKETATNGIFSLSNFGIPLKGAGTLATQSFVAGELAGPKRFLGFATAAFAIGGPVAWFDLATGTFVANTALANAISAGTMFVTMTRVPGGRWRCAVGGLANGASSDSSMWVSLDQASGSGVSHAGDATAGFYISDQQYETGRATSAIFTAGYASASRAADVLVLDCGSAGIADGIYALAITADDGSVQMIAASVAAGTATINASALLRPWVRSIRANPPVTPASRTVTLADTPPSSVYAFAQNVDPADVLDFKVILTQGSAQAFLQAGENVASYTLALTAQAVAAGLRINTAGGYTTMLIGTVVQFWLSVDPAYVSSSVFNAPGFVAGIELTPTTDAIPPRVKQRTLLVTLVNQ